MLKSVYDPSNINSNAFDRSNHSGSQSSSTISDFHSSVSSNVDVSNNTSKVSFPEAPSDGNQYARKNNGWEIVSGGSGGGDMESSTYDPNNVSGDAFNMDNMIEGASNKILTATERSNISANTAKVGITTQQANDITANNAKISATGNELESTDIDTLSKLNSVVTDATLINTTDPRLSDARTPTAHTHVASDITDFDTEVSNNSSVLANTAKNSYPSSDATKVGFISVTQAVDLDTIESDVASNNTKNSYPSADATKLSGIEDNAEVQDLTIRTKETTNFITSSGISNSYTECNNGTALQVTITDAALLVKYWLSINSERVLLLM